MKNLSKFSCIIICFCAFLLCFFTNALGILATSEFSQNNEKIELNRSLESLQDLDYRTWQLVVYPSPEYSGMLILRVVGSPGDLIIDHPTNLIVRSGRKNWNLKDITRKNNKLVRDSGEFISEFEITPLIADLRKNRPLKLSLKGLFSDLSIPPYLVGEWRSLIELNND